MLFDRGTLLRCLTVTVLLGAPAPVSAEGWSRLFGPPGCSRLFTGVECVTEWHGELVAVGLFNQIGKLVTKNIARWNGVEWQPFGPGLTDGAGVGAVAVYRDEVVAGGVFAEGGGSTLHNIARWDGVTWQPLSASSGMSGRVRAIHVHADDLYAAGDFRSADGIPVNGVAKWNGLTWEGLGGGLPGGTVHTLDTYGGRLVAGGSFASEDGSTPSYIAEWNGLSWEAVGGGLEDTVWDLLVRGDSLFVAGQKQRGIGATMGPIAVWDGEAWSNAVPGISGKFQALAEFRCELVTVGVYGVDPNGSAIEGVLRLTGSSLELLGGGAANGGMLYAYGDGLLLGGNFSEVDLAPAMGFAKWDGEMWTGFCPGHGLKLGNLVTEFITWNGEMYAAGFFDFAGCARSGSVARWTPGGWKSLGEGVFGQVRAMHVHDGDLIVGGKLALSD